MGVGLVESARRKQTKKQSRITQSAIKVLVEPRTGVAFNRIRYRTILSQRNPPVSRRRKRICDFTTALNLNSLTQNLIMENGSDIA